MIIAGWPPARAPPGRRAPAARLDLSADVVRLEQRVWDLLMLIPTNTQQRALYLQRPQTTDWQREFTTAGGGSFARRLYSAQLVEQLTNPAKALTRDTPSTMEEKALEEGLLHVCFV